MRRRPTERPGMLAPTRGVGRRSRGWRRRSRPAARWRRRPRSRFRLVDVRPACCGPSMRYRARERRSRRRRCRERPGTVRTPPRCSRSESGGFRGAWRSVGQVAGSTSPSRRSMGLRIWSRTRRTVSRSWPAGSSRTPCTGDLTTQIGLSRPTVSRHLRILVEAGLRLATSEGNGSTTGSSTAPSRICPTQILAPLRVGELRPAWPSRSLPPTDRVAISSTVLRAPKDEIFFICTSRRFPYWRGSMVT